MEFLQDVNEIRTFKLSVGTTPTIAASPNSMASLGHGRHTVEIYNAGSSEVYFGGKDVTVSTGIPIKSKDTRSFPVNSTEAVYLIASSATDVVVAEYSA